MLDGQTHWLSDDLRVFQIRPGGMQSGIAFPAATTAEGYLQTFVAACDAAPDAAGHPFRQIAADQNTSRLELSPQVDGDPVYNYAVARVRYRSLATPANDVRVFFRAFTTAATSMEYRPETYPWDATTQLPQVGANSTDVLSIPFFSVPRSAVALAGDSGNLKSLPASGAGQETQRYFGALLDINSTTPAIADPADGVVKSIQNLVRGNHQCLVAEIRFGPDPIPTGATPASNENLAQRNLAIVESDNPGPADAHTVVHTFQFKTTWDVKKVRPGDDKHHDRLVPPLEGAFDELMILWGGIPEAAQATLYMPAFEADDILDAAALRYDSPRLERVDAHTLRCRVGDISWVPLPAQSPRQVAALLTIVLPQTVKTGEKYRIQVRQYSRQLGRITGTFEVLILVRNAEDMLAGEARLLAVLKSIAMGLRPTSAWFLVFQRYVAIVADRVRGLGADPNRIGPSPAGQVPDGVLPAQPENVWGRCCAQLQRTLHRMTWVLALGLAVLVLLMLVMLLVKI